MAAATPPGSSSRDSEAGAGWQSCSGPGSWRHEVPAGTKSLSWLRPSTLWQSRNDLIARLLVDPTPAARARWIELCRQRARAAGADPDFVLSFPAGDSVSVLVAGDTGEGDNSQYAVALPLTEQAKTTDFAVICSDVIYPTGDRRDYGDKFHRPYRDMGIPIYALPGNHDWYDGLHGFMHHFCRLEDPRFRPDFGSGPRAGLAARLWRYPQQPPRETPPVPAGELPPPVPGQPAPYFALDAGPVRFVGIDTGIQGELDPEQYDWLRRVCLHTPEQPKILLTGKPIYVDNKYHPGQVSGSTQTVDDVVTDPRANFVLAIGGDIHNYQRYPVTLPDGRTIQYVVSGGGGAYMHATHRIPPVTINGVTEAKFRCYPLRRDSLTRFSQVIDKRLFGGLLGATISPAAAGRYFADRGIVSPQADRPVAHRLSRGERIRAGLLRSIPAGRAFHRIGSEAFDFDDPPFFKQFLRLDIAPGQLTVRCFGVTGCADTERTPSVEDCFTIDWPG